MNECIFCRIVRGEMGTHFEKETENFIVFNDISPSAPIHLLIVPKQHVEDLHSATDEQILEAKQIALDIAEEKGLKGFRIALNVGDKADVKHMHMHFVAGFEKERQV